MPSRRNRRMSGGKNESLSQGQQFRELLPQGGGAYTPIHGAPVGDQGLLDGGLRQMARVDSLDASIDAASKMRDPGQAGGARRSRKSNMRKSRKSRKSNMRKSRKGDSRKSRKGDSRKSRKSNMRKSRKGDSRKSRKGDMRKSRKGDMRKSRKGDMRKSRKGDMRKSRKGDMRKGRKMSGGAHSYSGAPVAQDPMLLSPAQAARAGTADFSNPLLKH